MAVSNRAAKLAKLHRVAKKNYQPVTPPKDRSVLEHMLYACCLEDSTFEGADEAFARLQQGYFDWNEVRVTTHVELAEVMDCLTDPSKSAVRLKKTLHSMFETHYTFDIDTLRKENQGKAIQKLESYKGITPFVISYVVQNALGGHSIPVDKSLINLMFTIAAVDEKEAQQGVVPGLERAIPKNKGVEFFSVTHQLAVAYSTSPFNNDTRSILLKVDEDARERFPKRKRKKKTAKKKSTAKASAGTATKKKSADGKKPAAKKKSTTKKTGAKSKAPSSKKKTASPSRKKPSARKKASPKKARKSASAKKSSRKSATKRLAKKKPR